MSVFDDIASEAADLTSAPSDEAVARLREKCVELSVADRNVARLEKELEEAKEKKNVLAHKELPDLFNSMGVDTFGLPDAGEFGADLILSPYFKASIPADWPDDQKAGAFDHLEAIGGGDLIRTEVKFSLGRGESELARKISQIVAFFAEMVEVDVPAASISQGVPWNSLTSFVKERHNYESGSAFAQILLDSAEAEKPAPVQMNAVALNATIGQIVKIKERKK